MTLNVKLKGAQKFIQVSGKAFEDDDASGELRVMDGNGKVIAKFNRNEVAGWWVEKEFELSEEDIKPTDEAAENIQRDP